MRTVSPKPKGNVQISATTTESAAVKVADGPCSFRLAIDGTVTTYVEFGGSAVVADTTGIAYPSGGQIEVITIKRSGEIYVSAITATGTATVNIHPVDGGV